MITDEELKDAAEFSMLGILVCHPNKTEHYINPREMATELLRLRDLNRWRDGVPPDKRLVVIKGKTIDQYTGKVYEDFEMFGYHDGERWQVFSKPLRGFLALFVSVHVTGWRPMFDLPSQDVP